MPQGWYLELPLFTPSLSRGEIVVLDPPKAVAGLMVERHYLLPHAVLIKHLEGLPGDFVCVHNHELSINQQVIGPIADQDSQGRALPQIHFCQQLGLRQYFVISTLIPNSFDSRYFGPVSRSEILGRAILLSNS